jgi:putative ABC transport system permease protein
VTAIATAPVEPRQRSTGGMPARRAVARWAVRLFRREWRQQLLVIALLTVAVGGATFGVAASYNLPSSSSARFGSADQMIRFDGLDARTLTARLAAARAWFGSTDTIGHRYATVPGLADSIDLRAQNPAGPYGAPMLALRTGRYPRAANEIAVTDAVAGILRTHLGAQVALDGHTWRVVGTVQNPKNFSDAFALVDPAHADPPQSVIVLVAGDRAKLDAFRAGIDGPMVRESRPSDSRGLIAMATLGLAAVGLLLVSLVAAAGFVVLAQRRMRQLGMLAAIGAPRRHLRMVMLINGAIVGAIAAVLGTVIGIGAWLAAVHQVEAAAGHHIDRLDLPWLTIAAGMGLAVLTATIAAWWPARAIAGIPIMSALSARPVVPRAARGSAVIAVVLLALGAGALVVSKGSSPALVVGGAVITAVGMLFVGPLAIRILAAARRPLPVALRLALTDLTRYQARSGAALAAISLVTGITVAIVAGSAAAEYTTREASGLGNLSTSQLLIRIGQPDSTILERTAAQTRQARSQLDAITAALGTPSVVPLQMAVTMSVIQSGGSGGASGHPAAEVGIPTTHGGEFASHPAYVATAALLQRYGLTADAIAPDVDVLTTRTEAFELVNIAERDFHPKIQHLSSTGYADVPNTLITAAALARHGWTAAPVGWFVQADRPLTSQELSRAQTLAAGGGLSIESHREQASLASLRTGATAIGILLCLGVLATTVGLIRGEGANDLRTLTATGAPRRVRRTLTATTAGALALLGVLLGLIGAYVSLASGLSGNLGALAELPVLPLAIVVVGLPLLATLAGWVLAGRQPVSFARRRLD